MHIDVITIFPGMFRAVLGESIIKRAQAKRLLRISLHDLRRYTHDRHRSVDDRPYGGGPGMVMKPEPLFRTVEAIAAERGQPSAVVLMTPQGRRFSHAEAKRLSALDRLIVICGRYEGVDERVARHLVTDEISIGVVNNKATAVRIIPVPGKRVGEKVVYGGLLGEAPIMPVSRFRSDGFIHMGGRIPAPIISLRN